MANRSSSTPRSRPRLAPRPEWRRYGCIRRTSVSPGVGGGCDLVAGFREKGVQRRYNLCALSDGSGNALDGPGAHVTDREYTRQVGFERPLHVCARAHEALVIEHHAGPRQPPGIRIRADEYKKGADRELRLFTGSVGATADRFKNPVLPFESGDRRLGEDFDVRPRGDAVDQ